MCEYRLMTSLMIPVAKQWALVLVSEHGECEQIKLGS